MKPDLSWDGDDLVVTMPGLAAWATLRTEIRVPLEAIRTAEVVPAPRIPFATLFRLGTHVPSRFIAGTIWSNGHRRFWFFGHDERVLRIWLENHPYREITVRANDPERWVSEIETRRKTAP